MNQAERSVPMNIISQINATHRLQLDLSAVKRADNGKVQVLISPGFQSCLRNVLDTLIRQQANPVPEHGNSEKLFVELRKRYQEMTSQLIHRIKSDLCTEEIQLLHFAIVKCVLFNARDCYQGFIEKRKNRALELKTHGSGELLKVQEHIAWMHKHSELILYRVQKQVLAELKRVESKHLKSVWRQTGNVSLPTSDILFVPTLACSNFSYPDYLLNHFYLWNDTPEIFNDINARLELLFSRIFSELKLVPLKTGSRRSTKKASPVKNEQLPCAPYLDEQAPNSNKMLAEYMCWLDEPDNIDKLFNTEHYKEELPSIRKNEGMMAAWHASREMKRLSGHMKKVQKLFRRTGLLKASLASRLTQEIWPHRITRHLDYRKVYQFLLGNITLQDLKLDLPSHYDLGRDEINALKEAQREVENNTGSDYQHLTFQILKDISAFRQYLKYYRFAMNAFREIDFVTDNAEISKHQLSGTLYELFTPDEIMGSERNPIVHDCMLTMELGQLEPLKKALKERGLKAADFFNDNFYTPVEEQTRIYGANVIKMSPLQIILSFHEYEKIPAQWYAVSHASALAQKFITFAESFNKQCRAACLPEFECRIGIAYQEQPEKQVDNEPAGSTGNKSFNLAGKFAKSVINKLPGKIGNLFNINDTDNDSGHNGIRHNGVILTRAAFEKLKQEILLQQITTELKGRPEIYYSGSTLLPQHNRTEFWLREGQMTVDFSDDSEDLQSYYELLSSPEMINHTKKSLTDQYKRCA